MRSIGCRKPGAVVVGRDDAEDDADEESPSSHILTQTTTAHIAYIDYRKPFIPILYTRTLLYKRHKRVNWWTRSLRLTRVDGVGRYTVYI